MSYAFFWVIYRHLQFKCQHVGTLFHLHTYQPMEMEQCSDMLVFILQMPVIDIVRMCHCENVTLGQCVIVRM
jgi:hypothetical protein